MSGEPATSYQKKAVETQIEPASFRRDLDFAIEQSQGFLLREQDPQEGYWCAELGADSTLVSDFVMLTHFLGDVNKDLERKAVRDLLNRQLSDGGWNLYEGGPSEVNASVKGYLALKLSGMKCSEPLMAKVCTRIRSLGGLERVNSFSRFYLALLGLIPWSAVPTVPPEIMLLPPWVPISIYSMSSWTRGILVPLSIVSAKRPVRRVQNLTLDELRCNNSTMGLPGQAAKESLFSRRNLFLTLDRSLKITDPVLRATLRRRAVRRAKKWMVRRIGEGGLGAIYPAMLNSIIALDILGYDESNATYRRAKQSFMELLVDKGDRIQFQPCFSPVWDTALTLYALSVSGMSTDHPALVTARQWLLSKQVTGPGDWSVRNPRQEPGGWYFEFDNEHYPDTDDTAMVLMALDFLRTYKTEEGQEGMQRGLSWLMTLQNPDGGWGAFDRGVDSIFLEDIPFADHNAILDPSTADLTARILELLGQLGVSRNFPAARRGVDFLLKSQEKDGSWYGRWGVNYLYGTWQVLQGLSVIGEDMQSGHIRRAIDWLKSIQHSDEGWGETCQTYEDPSVKGQGPSTPSQTAWAVMGLCAAGEGDSLEARMGIDYLMRTQRENGAWEESEYTGTGFPRVFYLRYGFYCQYFPLMALAKFRSIQTFGRLPIPQRSGPSPVVAKVLGPFAVRWKP